MVGACVQYFIFLTSIMWPHWFFFYLQRLYKRKTKKGDNSVTNQNFKKMRNAFLNHHMRKFLWTFQHRTSNRVGGSDDTKINKGNIRKKTRFITLSNIIFSKKISFFILEVHDRSLYAGFHLSNFNDVAAMNFLIYKDYIREKLKRGITQ